MIDFDNEDNLSSPLQSSWQPTFIATNRFISISKSETLFSTISTTIEIEKNKKYLDVSLFYSNAKDKEKWER